MEQPQASDLFDRIYRRHGHYCPMSTLGGRLGLAARGQFPEECSPDELRAVYHTDTCAVDGIEEAAGVSRERGTLVVREERRHCLRLVRRSDGHGVEVELGAAALARAGEYRRLSDQLELLRPNLPAAEVAARQQVLDGLLEELRRAGEAELFSLRQVVEKTEVTDA
ncbi:hypothetical protein DESUT3_30130 [Desulfuromonas versatilis]|uniref:Formylmethanofuran dehydrogenase subunit E domain-containing protein n=1 Tax=Desulfuromonas versatilis TaxID=2802975 RepID=A0ABN6E331_9BACT|nr:formylmethanofuran dehydrogenase subunit E family protein [Desulfuromonas versatilis]BCR05944.1 hypothetical protein DESUT3_30130 [Desulfuromonas versatilis]